MILVRFEVFTTASSCLISANVYAGSLQKKKTPEQQHTITSHSIMKGAWTTFWVMKQHGHAIIYLELQSYKMSF